MWERYTESEERQAWQNVGLTRLPWEERGALRGSGRALGTFRFSFFPACRFFPPKIRLMTDDVGHGFGARPSLWLYIASSQAINGREGWAFGGRNSCAFFSQSRVVGALGEARLLSSWSFSSLSG